MLLGILLSVFLFEEIVDDVFFDPLEGDNEVQIFDQSISQWVAKLRAPLLTKAMVDLTALGSISVIATIYLIFISVLLSFRDYKGAFFITIVLAGAGLWPALLKLYFLRERPEQSEWLVDVSDYSFPSGHSFGAAATYIGFAFYASQYARGWIQELFFYFLGILLGVLVGLSRIYLGVHYPTDVLAGFFGGMIWGLAASLTYLILHLKLKSISRLELE